MNRKRRSGEASLTTGLVLTGAFCLAWYLTRSHPLAWLWLFPIVFAGLLAARDARGLVRPEYRVSPQRWSRSRPGCPSRRRKACWSGWPARDTR